MTMTSLSTQPFSADWLRASEQGPAPCAPQRSAGPRLESGLLSRQRAFADALGKRIDAVGEAPSAEEKARKAAEDFVAATLVQPLLKQLRDTNQAAAPFAPGPAEKQFRGLADAQIAARIVRASSFPLVGRLASDLLRHAKAGDGSITTPAQATAAPVPVVPRITTVGEER